MTIAEYRKASLSKFEQASELFEQKVYPNIEKYRKGDCKIRFIDECGEPVKNAKIKVTQKTHDFKVGAHLFMLDEFGEAEKNNKYREIFSEIFNLATIPFYWKDIEPKQGETRYAADSCKVYRRPAPDLCLDYCKEKGIGAKLHCLVYDKIIPDWLPKSDEKEMERLYEKRFLEISERYAKKLYEIEVINEDICKANWTTNSVISKKTDVVKWSFDLAEKYFPNDTLVINDGNFIPKISEMRERHPYYLLIKQNLEKGARIDKIGIQNHIYCGCCKPFDDDIVNTLPYLNPEKILGGLEVLATLGKPLEITEVTIPTFNDTQEAEEIQAEILKYLYTLWFSVPQLENVVYWNTVEGTAYDAPNWVENNCRGGLLHADLTPKKSAIMLKKLFSEVWHTEEELTTDDQGNISFRGFYGDYLATSDKKEIEFSIHKNANNSLELNI